MPELPEVETVRRGLQKAISGKTIGKVAVSKDGKLLPEVLEVLQVMAKYKLALATGHVSANEHLLLVHAARAAGIDRIVCTLRDCFVTDYIVIGGGNARKVGHLPPGTRLGDNRNAFVGGLRLWGQGPGRADRNQPSLILR